VKQEGHEGVERGLLRAGHFEQGRDFLAAPSVDVLDLLGLLALHLGEQAPHVPARVALDLACLNGKRHDPRVHTRLADAPDGRPVEARPSFGAKVVGLPRVGGLHHRYV
jgi:hypothetical protein